MFNFATIPFAIAEKSFILLLNANFLRIHIYHQTTKAYDTREVHITNTTNLNENENFTIRLSICQRTSHYPVIKMSTNISLSCYQNVNEHLTILLSKCQRTSNYPVIKMSTNISLSGYQNVHEHLTIRLSLCQWTSHYPVIKMPTNISLSLWRCSDQQMRFNKYFLDEYFNWLSMNISLSGYQNAHEHLTIRLSKCQWTSHYPVIKMPTNISLSVYQNVNEYPQQLINTKIKKAAIFSLDVRRNNQFR